MNERKIEETLEKQVQLLSKRSQMADVSPAELAELTHALIKTIGCLHPVRDPLKGLTVNYQEAC